MDEQQKTLGDLHQGLLQLNRKLNQLSDRQTRLEASDRRQWAKLRAQRKYTLVFGGLLAVGAFVVFQRESISPENRAMLERIATAALAAGGTGLVGVNMEQFSPKTGNSTEDEDQWN
jgi:hypothetical protein